MAAILCIGANVNINFQIPDGVSFLKIYSFTNFERKIFYDHSDPD